MKTTFREKYVFDLRGKSLTASTLGLLWLPSVWYQDQNDEFESHKLTELRTISSRSGREDTMTKVTDWNYFQYEVASNVKTILGSLRLSAFWFEDQKLGFLKEYTSKSAIFLDWDPPRRNQACSYKVMFIRLSREIYIVFFSGNLRVSRLWCKVKNWQFFSQTFHQVVETSNWDLHKIELGLYLGRKVCLVLGKALEW